MENREVFGPTHPDYFRGHSDAILRSIVERFTRDSVAMAVNAPIMAREAMAVANGAWAELLRRGTDNLPTVLAGDDDALMIDIRTARGLVVERFTYAPQRDEEDDGAGDWTSLAGDRLPWRTLQEERLPDLVAKALGL